MKISAGILPYIKKDNEIIILLGHMGGPLYVDIGESYGIIKGEIDDFHEEVIKAAIREFQEETTKLIDESKLIYLGEAIQNSYKKNIIYIVEEYFDITDWKSNMFSLEWPKSSGKIEKFPEMDSYKWINLNEAKSYIRPTQLVFLEMLEEKLRKESE